MSSSLPLEASTTITSESVARSCACREIDERVWSSIGSSFEMTMKEIIKPFHHEGVD